MPICPACGYTKLREEAHTVAGPSFEICASCGFQPGYTDDDLDYSPERWREKWIHDGMQWGKSHRGSPREWNPVEQLKKSGYFSSE